MYLKRFFQFNMVMRLKLHSGFAFLLLIFSSAITFSQDSIQTKQEVRIVNGSIPIPFVAAMNISTGESSISDADGLVILPFRNVNDTLVFRSMGYKQLMVLPGELIGRFLPMDEMPVNLDEVRITSNIVPDVGINAGLVTAATISTTAIKNGVPPGNMAELLQSTGQLHVQQSQQGGGSPVIRGFEANRVLLVVDGVRLNNAIYRSGHLQNSSTVDPNSIEQIQVFMGPSSVRFGSDALGGVVHFLTRRPRFRSDNSESSVSSLFSAQFNSVNNSSVFHGTAEAGGPRWGTVVSFSASKYGDLKMGSRRVHGDSEWGLVPFIAVRIDGADSLMANPDPELQSPTGYSQKDFLHKLRFGIPGGAIETNIQYSTTSNISRFDKINDFSEEGLKWAEWNYGPQERFMTAISWEQYLGIPGSLHTTLAYQNISESRFNRLFGAAFREARTEEVDVYSMSSIWKSSPFRGDGWKFEAGVDGQWNEVDSQVEAQDPDGEPVVDPGWGVLMTRYPNGGSNMGSFGAFSSAKRSSGDKVYHLGLRYSHASINAVFDATSALSLPFSEIHTANGALTGSAVAEIPLGSNVSTVSSIASGFRHPNIDDATKIREKGGYVLIPNDSIKAEYLYSIDESITWQPHQNVSFTASGFFSIWVDVISPVNATLYGESTLEIDGESAIIQMNKNMGNAIIRGARFDFTTQVFPNTIFKSTVNLNKGTIITSDSPLAHIPPTFGRSSLEYSKQKWSIETFVLYSGKKNIDSYGPGSTDNPQETLSDGNPSWWTLNIESHLEFHENIHAQFGVSNILDMHYKSFSSAISAPGRGVYIALHATF
jgi:hemoglobin/transferrin/lactoferrin receptor protein